MTVGVAMTVVAMVTGCDGVADEAVTKPALVTLTLMRPRAYLSARRLVKNAVPTETPHASV